jgi:spermidine synthase
VFAVPAGTWPVYVATALSGFTALGSEVIWTNLLSLNLGATTYTFSLILGVFLVGLGIGSSLGAGISRNISNARAWLGGCQVLLVACMAWAAYALTQALPYWPINLELSTAPIFTFQVDLMKAFFTVFPGALLWGASFPLALAAVSSRDSDPGMMVGTTYAANTVGAILGSMLTSLVLIPRLGTQHSQQVLMSLAVTAGLFVLVFWPETARAGRHWLLKRSGLLAVILALAVWLSGGVIPVPPLLVSYGRHAVRWIGYHGEFIYVGEGMNSSMAVSRLSNGVLNYHNAGKIQASSEPQDMRLQRMLGHLATLLPKQAPRSVLVIGCGAGVTAGSVSIDPRVEREVIAEIEPLVPQVVSSFFAEHNFNVIRNPKVQVVVDDGRHYLLTTRTKFDAITSDPFDPWVKGAASLYTKEFFQLVKERLNPGGVVTVFVQLYESNTEAVKSEVATFLQVFPDGLIFGNTNEGTGYDTVLVGQANPEPIDIDAIEKRLASPPYAPVARSLSEIGMRSAADLLATFAVRGKELQPWLADAQINLDRNLRLQYLAGFGLNKYEQNRIYQEILAYRKFPSGIFIGSPERLEKLRSHNWR